MTEEGEVQVAVSPQRRREIVDALRRGTVPEHSLDTFAVGLAPFEEALMEELGKAKGGAGVFKAVRGEYGSGKTFFVRWLGERAMSQGFVTAEVQISEGETPLHRLETVYRRIVERLSTSDQRGGAFPDLVHRWFYVLEEDAIAANAELIVILDNGGATVPNGNDINVVWDAGANRIFNIT